jgi:enoyl-CoA hydratase/carnithine racemase
MTMSDLTTYELDGRIATITMDDGKVNAFSIPMLQALHAAFDRAEQDDAVVVLTGREGYFSAGFDLKVFASGDVERVVEMLRLGATLTERILSFKTPVLAACNGHAVAAGSFVLLAADLRIGTEGSFRLGLNEVKIGLTMPWFAIELAGGRDRAHVRTGRSSGSGLPRPRRGRRRAARRESGRGRGARRTQRRGTHRDQASRSQGRTCGDQRGDRE